MFQQLTEMFFSLLRPLADQQAVLAGWTYYLVAGWFLLAKLGFLGFVFLSHKRDLDRTGRVSLTTFKKAAWVMVPALMILGFDLFVVGPANLTAQHSVKASAPLAASDAENDYALSLLESGQR